MRLDQLRQNYHDEGLDPATLGADPLAALARWLEDALAAGMIEPNAMTLATADADGRVAARMVLLKGLADGGAVFYSNYDSRKGHDLRTNPQAALCFWWDKLERQVRLEGRVERLSEADSLAYFRRRPYGSQLAALASDQSRPLADRSVLEARAAELRARYPEGSVPRPASWGGYRLVPDRVEFWKGRRDRLHDRLVYTRTPDGWQVARLYP